jgi:hypothetical protein
VDLSPLKFSVKKEGRSQLTPAAKMDGYFMSEESKRIWKKSFRGQTALVVWLAVAAFAIVLAGFICSLAFSIRSMSDLLLNTGLVAIGILAAILLLVYLVWPLLRWLFWKHWRRTLFGLACFATLMALFYAEEDWRGRRDWEKFKREWEAKGERFDLQSVVPPPVPDDQNFALTPIVSSSYGYILTRDGKEIPYEKRDTNFVIRLRLDRYFGSNLMLTNEIGSWAQATETDLKVWQHFYRAIANATNGIVLPPQPQPPAADVLLALGKYDSTVEELREAAKLPYSRFPLEYDKEYSAAILLPHLAVMKSCAQLLQLRALAELQNDQGEKALADVKLLVRLVDSMRTEPFLITHLVRMTLLQIALQPVYEGLEKNRWSNAQLAELESEITGLNFVGDYKLAMRGELASQINIAEYMRRHPDKMLGLLQLQDVEDVTDSEKVFWLLARCHLIPDGWFYQNELHCAQRMVTFYLSTEDEKSKVFPSEKIRNGAAAMKEDSRRFNPFKVMERVLIPGLATVARKFAFAQTSVDLARTAIALERYRLAHGEFPGSLDALAPQFIALLPRDVIGGGPLHYRRTDDGQFVLYSIGWNKADDGGTVVTLVLKGTSTKQVDLEKGDWVWRYPAK